MEAKQFEWDVAISKLTYTKITLRRLLFTSPLIIAGAIGIYFLGVNQSYIQTVEALVVYYLIYFIFIAVLNLTAQLVYQVLPPQLIHFQLTPSELTKENKKIPLNAFSPTIVDVYLKPFILPEPQWKQPRPNDGNLIKLTLPSHQGSVKLLFSNEYLRQTFIQTFNRYLHPESST